MTRFLLAEVKVKVLVGYGRQTLTWQKQDVVHHNADHFESFYFGSSYE